MNTVSLIGFAIALALAALVILPLGGTLRRHPVPFYAVAVALTAVYVGAVLAGVSLAGVRPLAVIMQKGYLAVIFLFVVMFTGCFDEGTAVRRKLQPIRGELSILSFIFILGHLFTYLPGYLPRLGVVLTSHANIALSLLVATVLTALFLVLSVMSLRVVRSTMNKKAWKAIQRSAYVMVALLVAHVGLSLGASAFAGASKAVVGFALYAAVVAVYAVLRVRKALCDRERHAHPQVEGAEA